MHDISNVQVKDPVVLVLHTKNGLDVILQFHVACLTLLNSFLSLAFVYVVVCVLLRAA